MSTEHILRNGAEEPPVYSWPALRKAWGKALLFPELDLDIIRHGETELNRADMVTGQLDVALSELGREQAGELATYLRPPYAAIFASTQRRSVETLAYALRKRGLPAQFEIDCRLNERGLGEMEGKPRMFVPQYAAGDLDFAPVGGENYRSVTQRTLSYLLDLHQRSSRWPRESRILICGHMGPLRVLIAILTGEHDAARMMAQEWRNAMKFRTTISTVEWPRYLGWRVVRSL